MSIGADLIRGHTDAIILALLTEKDSYGYEINRTIYEASGGRYELKEATLYTAFKRLEDSGLISSYWGDQAGGARRKYYSITLQGLRVCRQMRAEWEEARDLINTLMERSSKAHA